MDSKWVCKDCICQFEASRPKLNVPWFKETLNFKHYHNHNGNVSKARIDMIKSRRLCPDGNGEVVITRNGRVTDRNAENY